MKRGVAIAIGASAILHVSALLLLDAVDPPDRRRKLELRLSREPVAIVVSTPSVPIDVTMIPVPPVPAVPPPDVPPDVAPTSEPARRIETPRGPAAAASSSAAAGETAAVPDAPAPDTTGRPGMLSMRGPGRDGEAGRTGGPAGRGNLAALGLGRLRATDAYDPEGDGIGWVAPDSGELDPSGGGTHRTRRPGFTGRVEQDGSVTMTDKAAFDAHLRLPNPAKVGKRVARGIEDWYRDPMKQVRAQEVDKSTCHKGGGDGTNNCLAAGDYGSTGTPLDDLAKYAARGQTDGEKGDDAITIPIVGGSAELTDWVMRKVGQDPYQADKLRWLDATRDERAHLGGVHRKKLLAQADAIIRKHLQRLWARTDLDLPAKRAALFELWDDGAEDGDGALVEAANRTRAQVIGFIRARLPAGSDGAYTAAELESFNRRRTSRTRFAPYAAR